MKKILTVASVLGVLALPAMAFAAFTADNFVGIATSLQSAISVLLVVMAGLAVIVFIYGIIKFILSAGKAEERKEARGYMIYSVIAFAIIIGLYGISSALLGFFGIDANNNIKAPTIQ